MNKSIFWGSFITLLMIIQYSCAYSNHIEVSPDDLWYSYGEEKWIEPLYPQTGIDVYCNESTVSEAYIKKGSYTSKLKLQSQGNNKYSASQDITDIYKLANSGRYTVSATCGNNTITGEFNIHDLRGEIENIEGFSLEGKDPVYLGSGFLEDSGEMVAYIKLYDILGSEKRDISIEEDVEFPRIYFTEDSDISFSDVDFSSDNYGTLFIIMLKDLENKGIDTDKEYTLKAEAEYTIEGTTKKFAFDARRAIVFGDKPSEDEDTSDDEEEDDAEKTIEISHDSDIVIDDETEKTIEINIQTENIANFSLDEDDITCKIYETGGSKSTSLTLADVRDIEDEDVWEIDVEDIPELDPDVEYKIEIEITYKDMAETETINVRQGIVLEGVMKDASGVIVPANIEFDGPTDTTITVGQDGKYKAILVAGIYDIILTYTKFSDAVPLVVKIEDVEIDSDTLDMAPDPIKYSHYSKGVSIDDMAVANLLELQIALPYSSAKIMMPYDESKIYDDSEIEVYRCTNWNRDRKDCVGNWEVISDIAINTINNFISFNTDTLSAFVISGKKTLELNIEDLPDSYYLNEEIIIKGTVDDSNGASVKNSKVNYCIKNTGICGEATTDASGDFESSIIAPDSEGKFEVIVGAQKEPYHASQNTSFFITTETKKEVKLILPDVSYIVLDGKSKVSFKVKNTGQEELNNVKISVSAQGISRDKFTVEPSIISRMDADDEQEIIMDIPLTSEYCMSMGCMTVYTFVIEVTSDELKDTVYANMIIEVKTEEDATNTQATGETEQTQSTDTSGGDEKGILDTIKEIAGSAVSSSPATGLVIGDSTTNSYIIIATIIVCFIIVAIKKKKQRNNGSSYGMNPAVNAIKRHIR